LLRVPARFVLLAGIGMAAVCAYSAQFFIHQIKIEGRGAYIARLLTAGVAVFCTLAAIGVWVTSRQPGLGFVWGAIASVLALAMIGLRERGRISSGMFLWGALILLVIDLGGISAVNMRFRPMQSVMWEDADTAAFLMELPDGYRVYSPSYSLSQQTAALFEIEMASGIDPLQLRSYAKLMESASGVVQNGYSVALPPLEAETPAQSNRGVIPDATQLGLLNVGYVITEYDIDSDEFRLLQQIGETRVYQNRLAFPRAWVQQGLQLPGGLDRVSAVQAITVQPNDITIQAEGPGELVLSEVSYPGWVVRVDGEPSSVLEIGSILRGVELPAGKHGVRFVYRPRSVFIGVGLALAGWLAYFGLFYHERRDRNAHSVR